jgi:hypothetical protein
LVNLAAVYSRQIEGQTLTLAPSGWTYNNTFVLYDRETGSLWYPYENGLMSIQGKYFKEWLAEIPSEDVRWGEWIKRHPDSSILK